MSLLNNVRNWFQNRKQQSEKIKYMKGYTWALDMYDSGKMSVQDIESHIPFEFNKDEFSRGANDALRLIRRVKQTKANALFK